MFLDRVSLHTLYQPLYHMFSLDIRASYLLRVINLAEFSVGTSLLLLLLYASVDGKSMGCKIYAL